MLRSVYNSAKVVNSGRFLTTVNELCDQQPATRSNLLGYVVTEMLARLDPAAGLLITEEDKGAAIAGALCVASGLPLAMARHYAYDIGTPAIAYDSEYVHGSLHMNGILPGDQVAIVDDTLSTGGVIAALIRGIRDAGANPIQVIVAVEKVANGGRQKVEALGVPVESLISVEVDAEKVRVLGGIA